MRPAMRQILLGGGIPQWLRYKVSPGTLIEDFENSSDFSFGGTSGGSAANDTSHFRTGSKSLKIACASSASSNYLGTKNVSLDLSAGGQICVWLYIPEPTIASSITLYFSSANFVGSKYISKTLPVGTAASPGAQVIVVNLSEFSVSGSESLSNTMTQMRVRVDSGCGGGTVYFDSMYYRRTDRPRIVLGFDDGWATQYSVAFPYMQARGMKGTLYTVKNLVGSASYVTLAQLQEMYGAGWDVANHTDDHIAFNSFDNTAVCASQTPTSSFTINGDLASGGTATFGTPRNIVFRSTGNEQNKAFTVTGQLGGTAQTETVFGWNINSWATTKLFDTVTGITISAAAAAAITVGAGRSQSEIETSLLNNVSYLVSNGMPRAAYHFAYPQGEYNSAGDAALVSQGIITARALHVNATVTALGFANSNAKNLFATGGGGSSLTLASMKAFVDSAVNYGATYHLYLHNFISGTPSLSTDWKISDFQALVDYIAAYRNAGTLDVLTITEWWQAVNNNNGA